MLPPSCRAWGWARSLTEPFSPGRWAQSPADVVRACLRGCPVWGGRPSLHSRAGTGRPALPLPDAFFLGFHIGQGLSPRTGLHRDRLPPRAERAMRWQLLDNRRSKCYTRMWPYIQVSLGCLRGSPHASGATRPQPSGRQEQVLRKATHLQTNMPNVLTGRQRRGERPIGRARAREVTG